MKGETASYFRIGYLNSHTKNEIKNRENEEELSLKPNNG